MFLDIYEMFVLQGHIVWINAHIALWSVKYVSKKQCVLWLWFGQISIDMVNGGQFAGADPGIFD